MAYTNNNGQVRIGVRSGINNSPIVQPAFSASLLQSLYGVWNGDTTTNELDKSLFGVWNAENSTNTLDTNVYSVFTDLTTYTNTGLTNSQAGLWDAEGLGLNDKVGTNHLTSFGSATFSTDAILGTKSFTFTTATQYFGLPINSWNFTGDFSVSFWAKANWANSCIPISNCVWVQTSPIKYSGWQVGFNASKPYFYGVSGGTTSFSVSSAINCVSNSWSNVVVTKSNNVVSIYVNGLLGGTSSVTGNITYATTSYPSIGAQKYSSTGVSDHIGLSAPGSKFDNISTWTRALSHDDVITLYNSGSGQSYPYTQPVTISVDRSQSLTGFVLGTGSTVVSGKTGNAISLTQSTSIILKDISAMRFTGDFSVSFWFKTPDVTTGKALISRYDGQRGWYVYIVNGNIIWVSGGSTNVTFGFNPTTLVANTWYHVAVSLTNNVDVKCYLNGVLGGQNSMVSKTITYDYWNSYHPVVIGGRANNDGNTIYMDLRFNGIIDDMVVWTRPITQNEVNQLYNGTTGVEYPYSGKLLSSPNDNFGTNHGTLMNGCTFTTGKIGSAFTFDGVNDYVSLPDNIFNFTGDFSASAWVYLQTLPSTTCGILGNFNFGAFGGWGMYLSGGNLVGVISNSGGRYYLSNTTSVFTAGQWTNVVMVFKKNIGFYIYANGVLAGQSLASVNPNFGVSPNSSTKSYIGLLNYSGDWWWMPNGSRIDGVNVWQRSISQDEITQLYNSGTGAQYPFTGTFSSASNQLGMDNGTLVNGCSLTTGKVGQAFTFDEVNDYVSLPNNSLNFTGDFSVNFWVYTNISFRVQFFFSNYSVGSTYGYGYYCSMDNGKMTLTFINGGTHESSYQIPYTWTQNWHHVVITRKRSTSTKVYINGSIVPGTFTFGDVTKNPSYQANQICNIGGILNGTTNLLNGKMDAFTTWQKELTQAEVTELYNSGNGKQITATPIVQSGLVLNLDASRSSSYTGTGTTWTDISGNAKNGTIFNSPIFGTAGDGSFLFNASNQQIRVGSVTSGLTLTYNMWIRLSTISQQMLFWDGSSADGNDFWTTLTTDGKIRTLINNTTYLTSNSSITANTWYNVSIVTTSTGKSIYINGVLDSTDNTPILTRTGYSYLSIGYAFDGSNNVQGWMGGTNLRGNIGSFNIYNRSLSATEITQNFNATKGRFGL
jgi:hypothetical protein